MILLLFGLLAGACALLAQPNLNPRLRVHDPSTLIQDQGQFWTFATGDGVKTLRSSNLIDWYFETPAFKTNPPWTLELIAPHRDYYWAPDVIHANGCYYLYYSISSWGKNTSAIGVATNVTLDPKDPRFGWHDAGVVVQSFATNTFNTIDPAVSFDSAGKLWLAFGSFWSGIKLIELDPKTGGRVAPDSPMYSLAFNDSIEAACIYRHATNYFLFVNWGQCCRGTNSTYEIRVGRSSEITGPYLDRNGKDMLQRGGTLFLSSQPPFYGPGHAGIINIAGQDWLSCHYYDGNRNGISQLWVGRLNWDSDGWPLPPRMAESTQLHAPN